MKNEFSLNISSGQNPKPSATITLWDAHAQRTRDCLVNASDLDAISSAATGMWVAHPTRGNDTKWYAQTKIWDPEGQCGRTILMHRIILGLTDPEVEVDHRDNDGLNNQRYNLRKCTHKENARFHDPDRDWYAIDRARELMNEYRIERSIAHAVQERFQLSRTAMYASRIGKTSRFTPARIIYQRECLGKCRTLGQMKADFGVPGQKFGVATDRNDPFVYLEAMVRH